MNFQPLFIASLALNQFVNFLSSAKSIIQPLPQSYQDNPIMGFENTSPDNTWILKSTGDDIDYIITHYYGVLPPGQQQWLEANNLTKNFIYQVCDTSGQASVLYVNGPGEMCAVYSGAMINISVTPYEVTARAVKNTAINSISVAGDFPPYAISATSLPPPECDLPYPMQYADEKWRIVSLEGATLLEPQFPNICDLFYFAQVGVNTVRLSFKWDYLQCFLGQDIPINWEKGGYGAQIIKLINAWTAKHFTVILSMYDHMRYSYCAIGASDCWVSQERYAHAWQQIATQFVNNSHVVFGLMNQPNVFDIIDGKNNGTTIVLNNQNAAARAIRSTGAEQLILYSGNGKSKISSWDSTEYGDANSNTFTPENITDTHYAIEAQMFYPESEESPEQGCIAIANDSPQSCVQMQTPENFIHWMQETGIQVLLSQTGGTNSSACIICINQGTMWAMMQYNITGIGMVTAGHVWVDFNGDVENPLYLAPIHNISQLQMTQGFQNVSNPKTRERFLISLSSKDPSAAPTRSPSESDPAQNYFSTIALYIYTASGTALLATLYFLGHYGLKKNDAISGGKWCEFFGDKRSSLNDPQLIKSSMRSSKDVSVFI
ncbi:MAG: cellulase family glycosylhydrolase [Gammaproteobacteria bacterium]|nr:cellulase family glycosylhydrolase [Gammaproteobacteria bacterium]